MTRLVQALRARRRLASASLIALYSAVLIGSGLHEAIERHEVCEHGALVHAGSDHLPAADSPAAEGLSAPAPTHDDGHAHCSVDLRSEELGLPALAPLSAAMPALIELERTGLGHAVEIASLPALTDAPKQSPPALG
jgi:hypothetical protein